MKNVTINHSEQVGKLIYMRLSNGGCEIVTENNLMLFIELNRLNIHNEYVGNNSPLNDNDPVFDLFEEREFCSCKDFLDEHFDKVCNLFFKDLYK